MWIYEYHNWTQFSWDIEKVTTRLTHIRYQQGHLFGRMSHLGFDVRKEATLGVLTEDVIKSFEIEGEFLNHKEVRSSISKNLGLSILDTVPVSRHVEGIVSMMLDATQRYEFPLTKERLFDWHSSLFPTGRSGSHKIVVGSWRNADSDPMKVVSGPIGKEKTHFIAPQADRIDHEMTCFIDWFENYKELDPILRAGIAHFWFITIHPFEDGNGRIARAIADMALARSDHSSDRFYSLSSQIELERSDYYDQLEKQQRKSSDITEWMVWFLSCLERAINNADTLLNSVLFKVRFWEKANHYSLNDRQRYVLTRMCESKFKGYMNTSKYATLSKCSTDTALRDLQSLLSFGIIVKNPGGGRSTSYRLFD